METEQFVRSCHQTMAGWIPLKPLTQHVKLGDFFRIHDTGLRVLGNINRLGFAHGRTAPAEAELSLPHKQVQFSQGVRQILCTAERAAGDHGTLIDLTRLVLGFAAPGSFIFHGSAPRYHLLKNWHDFEVDITVKLTQSDFAFRNLYVITQLLTLEDWALAIAGEHEASLELLTAEGGTDHYRLFAHSSAHSLQCKGISTFLKPPASPAGFFKARKLALKQSKKDFFLHRLLTAGKRFSDEERSNWFEEDLLNLVEANELNIATCLEFFEWQDASLEDALRLC